MYSHNTAYVGQRKLVYLCFYKYLYISIYMKKKEGNENCKNVYTMTQYVPLYG